MSEMLEKARNYETEKQVYVKKTTKPLFHVTAPTGWINDPNGFSVYDGKIHLFYQYNPYQREWGPMHWGHSVTDDLSLIHISEPTRLGMISYAVFCLKKKKR